MKPELYFEIPDDSGAMLAVIKAIPATWGWVSGELSAPGDPTSLRLNLYEAKFSAYRRHLLYHVRRGFRGGIEVCHSACKGRVHQSPARVNIQLVRWIGWQSPEIGWQPARVRLSWHQFITNATMGSEYNPVVDVENSGRYEDVASVADVCRRLGLREYEVIRASDCLRDWRSEPLRGSEPFAIAAE